MRTLRRNAALLLSIIAAVVLAGNIMFWHDPLIGLFAGVPYILLVSYRFGKMYTVDSGWALPLGGLLLLATIAVLGAAAIYVHSYTESTIILLTFILPLLTLLAIPIEGAARKSIEPQEARRFPHLFASTIVWVYLGITAGCFGLLWLGQTDAATQSPWQTVSGPYFLAYFGATTLLLCYLFISRRNWLAIGLTIVHTFLTSAGALIVYTIGYGFDPFIHQATETIIAQTGGIEPTPLYYLGQYGIVIFLSKLLYLDIGWIDRALVPVTTAIFQPTLTFFVLRRWLQPTYSRVMALAVLAIPATGAIMTAPQNLANLFFLLTVLLSLLYFRGQLKGSVLYLLGLATAAIHPIAGIPLLIAVVLFTLFRFLYTSYKQNISLYFLSSLAFTFVLPLAFIVQGSGLELQQPKFRIGYLTTGWFSRGDLPLDFVYTFERNLPLFAIALVGFGLYLVGKNKLLRNNTPYLVAAVIVAVNFLIVRYWLTFPALSDFDRNSFTKRLAILLLYLLLPLLLTGAAFLIRRFWEYGLFTKIFLIFLLSGLISSGMYLSYPQRDAYRPTKFYSLSAADLQAVRLIEQTANPDHVVLANQMVSVGAIREFGFARYYNNQFYYSMPNGQPRTFYDHYLAMIYSDTSRTTMLSAMDEAGVDQAFFVINRYWSNSSQVISKASQSADASYSIDDGEVFVFRYDR